MVAGAVQTVSGSWQTGGMLPISSPGTHISKFRGYALYQAYDRIFQY